ANGVFSRVVAANTVVVTGSLSLVVLFGICGGVEKPSGGVISLLFVMPEKCKNEMGQVLAHRPVIVGVSHVLRGDSWGCVPRSLFWREDLDRDGERGFDYLTFALVSLKAPREGVGIRVADSHAGNHPEGGFTPFETIQRLLVVIGRRSRSGFKRETFEPERRLIEIILFIVDSGCSKHMTGNLKLLSNFVEKFLGTVKFGNDKISSILGYGDLVQGTITIKRVYYVKGVNHNLFSVGQFCDADLEVAFRKSTCYIRDLKGNDLLTCSRGINMYSITLQETSTPNSICLMAKATLSHTWLWHRRLSLLNFDTVNLLSKNDIVTGLPKLKFVKDHLCSSCELGKAKRKKY
ncbi:retrovirus-related pol polyprotein from transposon TNT 1-94, partial [Tanacetum coccineum]